MVFVVYTTGQPCLSLNQGYRDLQILLLDSVDSAALSRDSKIGSHWYWAEPGFADNSDINKTIEQPLSKN